MAPLSHSDRRSSDIKNPSYPERHPTDLCGKWTYEYKSPHCPHGNQHIIEKYKLLSSGIAHQSSLDKYDEGTGHFSEWKSSGWGEWFVDMNGDIVITCLTTTTSSVGRTACDAEKLLEGHDACYSESQLRESSADFISKHTRQKFSIQEEDRLQFKMRRELKNVPSKTEYQGRCGSKPVSQSAWKPGAPSTSQRSQRMLSRSRRSC